MKQWLREHPGLIPAGFSPDQNTSHQLRGALKRAGWSVRESETEVHLIPPGESGVAAVSPVTRGGSTHGQVPEPGAGSGKVKRCFVIQPFDKGRFDKRYEDTFRPAIIAAGLEPYRVDEDPASVVPIEDIEEGIRHSDACFAEITTDNPNVWFELGFAIAANKLVVMACADDRLRFPFDVQHRSIIKYRTESARDFAELAAQITRRFKAGLEAQAQVQAVQALSPETTVEGLKPHELAALMAVASLGMDRDPVSTYDLRQQMARSGYAEVACAIAIRALEKKHYIERMTKYENSTAETPAFLPTDAGLDWLDANHDKLPLND